jgi:hypothetical protein
MAACATVVPVSAASLQNLPAAPGAKLRVRVQPAPSTMAMVTVWSWSALFGDGLTTELAVTPLDPQATQVELPIEKPGRYTITARGMVGGVGGGQLCITPAAIGFAVAADKRLAQFRVRITPPASAGPFPVQETAVQAMAGVSLTRTLPLTRGEVVTLQPRDELGTRGIASYVRVSQVGSALTFDGYTGRAEFKPALLSSFTYDVLFVPDENIAPFAVGGLSPAGINVLPQTLSAGTALTGRLLDGGGAPLEDGRVILRAGLLSSTVGKSGAAGDYSLRVRPGRFAVTVSPPPQSGLPELTLPVESGLDVPDAPSLGSLEVRWAAVTPAPISLVVNAASGSTMAVGARVRLERVEAMTGAGTLVHRSPGGDPVMRSVTGQVRVSAQVGSNGSVALPPVPPGNYRLQISPADGDPSSALTTVPLDVPAQGVSGRVVRLAAKVKLRGTLTPSLAAANGRVYAQPVEADPPRPLASAIVGAGGEYGIDVDPDRIYLVWFDPEMGKPFARFQLARVQAAAGGADVGQRMLPRALAFTGMVGGNGGEPVSGAVLQVFCEVSSPSCLDSNLPLAEGVTDGVGRFQVGLPDPGTL